MRVRAGHSRFCSARVSGSERPRIVTAIARETLLLIVGVSSRCNFSDTRVAVGYTTVDQTSYTIVRGSGKLDHAAISSGGIGRTFSLVGYPDSVGRMSSCRIPADGPRYDPDAPQVYGNVFGMNIRFLTGCGEGPLLRTLSQKEAERWHITTYDVYR